MKLTEFISDIGRPVSFYPGLRKITGSTTATLFLCQMIYWTGKQADPDGWIYKTSSDLEEETGLSYKEQVTARKQLIELGFIEEDYKRLDHQMRFRIMANVIDGAWGNHQRDVPETPNHTFGKIPTGVSLNSNTEITTEITTETTAENTAENIAPDPFDVLQNTLEGKGILMAGKADVEALLEIIKNGATKEDLLAGIEWKAANNSSKVIRYVSQLIGPTKTATAKRLQGGDGGPVKEFVIQPGGRVNL